MSRFFGLAGTPPGGAWWGLYLDLLQLLLVGGIHLLKSLLQLPVPLQQALAQLGGQLQVCVRDTQSSGFGSRVAETNPLPHFSIQRGGVLQSAETSDWPSARMTCSILIYFTSPHIQK